MSGKIFINYRRGDDPGFTQALYQRLEIDFTRDQLFLDIAGHIRPGDDFVEVLAEQVKLSDLVLVVIGPRWSQLLEARQGDPDDFVLIEIQAALEQGKRVIPVLVGGARMPVAAGLPRQIHGLARRNAVELRPERFAADTQALSETLRGLLNASEARPIQTPDTAVVAKEGTAPARPEPNVRCDGRARGRFPHQLTMSARYLRWLLAKLMPAISSNPDRHYLNGIYLHPDTAADGGAILRAVATDGHRLALNSFPSSSHLAGMPGTIVPRQAVHEIYALLQGATADVVLSIAPKALRVEVQGRTYDCEPIDGIYPDYIRAIPLAPQSRIVVPRRETLDIVEALAIADQARPEVLAVGLEIMPGMLRVFRAQDGQSHSFDIKAVSQSGASGTIIGFNSRYLDDFLQRLDGDAVELAVDDGGSPATLKESGANDLLYVLMPMRL